MRVALYHLLPPGGARRYVAEHVKRIREVHDVDVFTIDLGTADPHGYVDSAAAGALEIDGPITRVPLGGRGIARLERADLVRRVVRAERRLASDIDHGRYDVALVHPSQVTQAPWLLRHLRTPSLYVMQEVRRESFDEGFRRRAGQGRSSVPRRAAARVLEAVLRRGDLAAVAKATGLVSNSAFSAEVIRRCYGRDSAVCHPGVDVDTFALRVGERELFTCVGAIDPVKDQELAIRAVGRLHAPERRPLHLVFQRQVDWYADQLVSLARSVSVELVLRPQLTDAALAETYGRSVATLCAALQEPFGLTPLESMSCGTPVVAVDEGGYRETVAEGVNGRLVPRSDEALADGVRRVAAAHLDPTAVRGTVLDRWTWDRSAERVCEELAKVAG